MVFEAGLGFGRTSWDPVVPLLRDDAHLVTYDRIGHGQSEPGDGPTSIQAMAATLCQHPLGAVVNRPSVWSDR